MSIIPTFDAGGRIFPVAGDEFYIDPGIVVQIAAEAEIEVITNGTRFGIVSGTDFKLKGVDGTPILYRVLSANYPTSNKEN